jgi:hypothetical protein
MAMTPLGAIAVHMEAAKRLLRELEQHAETALQALSQESGSEFMSAVDERDRVLTELGEVVEALSEARSPSGEPWAATDPAARVLFADMARAAAAALESHDQLAAHARRERDRLGAALQRTGQPDSVAHHYAVSSASPRMRTISVTG